jgi:hypothetical protein
MVVWHACFNPALAIFVVSPVAHAFWGSLRRATASWWHLDPKRAMRSGSLWHG